jgi:hypothetical protein
MYFTMVPEGVKRRVFAYGQAFGPAQEIPKRLPCAWKLPFARLGPSWASRLGLSGENALHFCTHARGPGEQLPDLRVSAII